MNFIILRLCSYLSIFDEQKVLAKKGLPDIFKKISFIFGAPSYGGSFKISIVCLSVRLSVHPSFRLSVCLSVCQFSIFLRNGSLVFSHFLDDDRKLEYLKTDRVLFSRKIHFLCKLGQKGTKMVPK